MQEEISKEEISKEETTIKETTKKKSLLSKIIGITFAGSIVCGLLYVLINLFFTGMYLVSAFKESESETETVLDSEDKHTVIQEEWIPLAERTSHPEIREVVNKLFTWERGTYDINLLYTNQDGEADPNTTLYNCFMQGSMTKFLDRLSIGGIDAKKLQIAESGQVVYIDELLEAIEASYTDVDTSRQVSDITGNTFIDAQVLRVMVNAYFGIFDDTEGCYDGDRPLTRAEFLAGLYKTRFPVQELTINGELASFISKDDPYIGFVSEMLPYSYLNLENDSLNEITYYGYITKGEVLYTLIQLFYPESLSEEAAIDNEENTYQRLMDATYSKQTPDDMKAVFDAFLSTHEIYQEDALFNLYLENWYGTMSKDSALHLMSRMFSYFVVENPVTIWFPQEILQNTSVIQSEYESQYPEYVQNLNDFLATGEPNILTEENKNLIKFFVYTMEEPYRTMFFENIDKFEIGYMIDGTEEDWAKHDGSSAYFTPADNTVCFEDATNQFDYEAHYNQICHCGQKHFDTIRNEIFNPFFHECGHAIDYNNGEKGYTSLQYMTYSDVMGKDVTLMDAVFYDVYTHIENQIRQHTSDETEISNILETFRYGHNTTEYLTENENTIREKVIEYYSVEVSSSTVNDIMGGITNLVIGYGHGPIEGTDIKDFHYWYDKNGEPTGAQAKELWAGYFAAVAGNAQYELEDIQTYFPEAYKVLQSMAAQMYQDIIE